MSGIIDIGELILSFWNATIQFQNNLNIVNEFTIDNASQVIYSLIDASINERLYWAKPFHEDRKFAVIRDKLRWFDINCNDEYSNLYNVKVFDPFEVVVGELLDTILPEKTWDLIKTSMRGLQLIVLNEGDYRIHDWMRRVKSGEIKWKP